jgi:hypothetical protein
MSLLSPPDDLDLHGYTVAEAIDLFVHHYNGLVDNDQFGCLKVIHGYGSSGKGGAIRIHFRSFLNQHLDKLRYEAGENYGDPGWTWVYPKLRLPDSKERMTAAILGFCSEGKTEEKILREFVQMGDLKVRQAIRSLTKQGKLKAVNEGNKVLYQAVWRRTQLEMTVAPESPDESCRQRCDSPMDGA